jgi:hypothetical protein
MNVYEIFIILAVVAVVIAFIVSPFMALYELIKGRKGISEEIKKHPLAYVLIPIIVLLAALSATIFAFTRN